MHPKMLKGLENLLRATDSLYNYGCYSLPMECRLKLVQVYCLNSDIYTCSACTICLRLRHTSGSMHDLQLPMLFARLSQTQTSPVYSWRGMGFGLFVTNKNPYALKSLAHWLL